MVDYNPETRKLELTPNESEILQSGHITTDWTHQLGVQLWGQGSGIGLTDLRAAEVKTFGQQFNGGVSGAYGRAETAYQSLRTLSPDARTTVLAAFEVQGEEV